LVPFRFAVYMDAPTSLAGWTWVNAFAKFPSLSNGCHPVDIIPFLSKWGFRLKKDVIIRRFGFSVRYLIAEG